MLLKKLFEGALTYFEEKSNYLIVNINIPKDIFLRTELICTYISDTEHCIFDTNTFIFLLYLDFIRECIENYNPDKVLKKLTYQYIKDNSFIISNGYENYQIQNTAYSLYELSISFDKTEVNKGQLILDELFEIFHTKITFNTLIEKLWIGFIQDYKNGDNKKAFSYLKHILQANL